jgi:hypothetical protein
MFVIRLLAPIILAFGLAILAPRGAHADAIVENIRIPLDVAVANPCEPSSGLIFLLGEVHRLVMERPDGSRVVHEGIRASGLAADGTRYTFSGTSHVVAPTPAELNLVSRQRLISQGPADNALFLTVIRIPPDSYISTLTCVG